MERIGHRGERELVRSWGSEIDDVALRQALTSARCQAVSGPVALMPDAHLGIGATVGSVIPTEGAIIPAAVGVDLGCGMIAVRTDLGASDLPDSLDTLLVDVEQAIPAGFAAHPRTTKAGARWLAADPLPHPDGLTRKDLAKAGPQLGTLGGGNHFVEVSLDEADRVWCVLHSGSRGVGNRLATGHIAGARQLCADLQRALEDRDLAYFLQSDEQFERYVTHMLWAQRYAFANREIMMDALLAAVGRTAGRQPVEHERINCHHNYAARETHEGRSMWITRKGAIRARVGDRGVVPGSMGADTYVVTGLGNSDSYESAAHGAGRRMSRRRAKREVSIGDFQKAMAGRTWQHDRASRLVDESPMAYKDIATVMADQADLVRVDHVLRAVMNYKGAEIAANGAFEGKVAVITGAASGLGRGIADRFGAAGCSLVLADVEEPALAHAAAELSAAGIEVSAVLTDVSDAAAMDALGEAALERHGGVDLLFNNAGVGIDKRTDLMTTQDWEWILGVNLWGVIHGLRVFLPHMLARDTGRIINTASSAGHVTVPRLAAYNASKHAVVAISETVRAELAQQGSAVSITAFCPGMVRTKITSSARNRPEELRNPGERLPERDNWDEKMASGRQDALETRFGRAKQPAEAAAILHDALLEGRFYVWTDDIFVEGLRQRYAEIQDSFWTGG